jgi:hypothetical protein
MFEILFGLAAIALLVQRIQHNRKVKRILDQYQGN